MEESKEHSLVDKSKWFDNVLPYNHEFPCVQWYIHEFGVIPNVLFLDEGIHPDIIKFFIKRNFKEVNSVHRLIGRSEPALEQLVLVKEDVLLLIVLNKSGAISGLKVYYSEKERTQSLVKKIKEQLAKMKRSDVWLVREEGFFDLRRIEIAKTLENDQLELNYGKGFQNVHDEIRFYLGDFSSRFILLYGKPGTGKTNYLRYLVNDYPKKFIYIPNLFLAEMSGPSLTDFLLKHKGAVFIIEDSEKLLMSRKNNPDSHVNTFLNMTDGFLSDVFSFKFIVTVNGDIRQIDEALVRKGRLAMAHEFRPLNEQESNELGKYLNIEKRFTGENTLADIYNLHEKSFDFKDRIGF